MRAPRGASAVCVCVTREYQTCMPAKSERVTARFGLDLDLTLEEQPPLTLTRVLWETQRNRPRLRPLRRTSDSLFSRGSTADADDIWALGALASTAISSDVRIMRNHHLRKSLWFRTETHDRHRKFVLANLQPSCKRRYAPVRSITRCNLRKCVLGSSFGRHFV